MFSKIYILHHLFGFRFLPSKIVFPFNLQSSNTYIYDNDSFLQTNGLPSNIGFQVYTYFVTKFMTRTSLILKHSLSSNRSLSQHNLGQASRGRTSEMRLGNRGLPSPDVNAHATMNNPVACHNYPTTSARAAENNPFFTLIRRI